MRADVRAFDRSRVRWLTSKVRGGVCNARSGTRVYARGDANRLDL